MPRVRHVRGVTGFADRGRKSRSKRPVATKEDTMPHRLCLDVHLFNALFCR
jgi:hypothetical protein